MSEYSCYEKWMKEKPKTIDIDPDEEPQEIDIQIKPKTHIHNGILYDGDTAIDYCDVDRDYDY